MYTTGKFVFGGFAQGAIEILGNDTAGDDVKIGALQALHILLEPIDNANGQYLRSHHCKVQAQQSHLHVCSTTQL